MLLWMLMVVGELTGSHYFSANGWFVFTIISKIRICEASQNRA